MIYELSIAAFAKAWPLFQGVDRSQSIVHAVFEGNHVGRIFVDDPQNPSTALAALACEYIYPVGRVDNPAFIGAMRELILSELVSAEGDLLLFPTLEAWQRVLDDLFADFNLLHVARKVFSFYPDRFKGKYNGWRKLVPQGYTVQRYDHRLAEGIGLAEFWGSLDHFLENGVGFAVLLGDEVVSRCHTVMVGNGEAEISIETIEPYRRQGFATLAGCAFIEYCMDHGLRPTWSCWDNNIASQILAQKLAFNHPVDIPVIYTKVK